MTEFYGISTSEYQAYCEDESVWIEIDGGNFFFESIDEANENGFIKCECGEWFYTDEPKKHYLCEACEKIVIRCSRCGEPFHDSDGSVLVEGGDEKQAGVITDKYGNDFCIFCLLSLKRIEL